MSGFEEWAQGYFAAKSNHDLESLIARFDPAIGYEDAVLGRRTEGADRMRATYAAVFAAPADDATSTLLWTAGGTDGGVVRFHNGPGLFGAPMDLVGVIELVDGRVARQRDYWDGRSLPESTLLAMRTSYPAHFRPAEMAATARATPPTQLVDTLAAYRRLVESGRDTGELLASQVTMEELGLGLALSGRRPVVDFLARWAGRLPYGTGAADTNVVGGTSGGAGEWSTGPEWADCVGVGVTAVGLDPDGRIERLATAWDTSHVDSDVRRTWPGPDSAA